jgi:hypothetical protein
MQTFNYHLYYYKMIIIHNDTDNDDMVFQCDYKKWLYLNMAVDVWLKHDYYAITWIILTWKIVSDCEMIGIWITS